MTMAAGPGAPIIIAPIRFVLIAARTSAGSRTGVIVWIGEVGAGASWSGVILFTGRRAGTGALELILLGGGL